MEMVKVIFKYIGVFILSVLVGFLINLLVTKLNSEKVIWNDTVGKSYLDIKYGEKDSNKFDVYVPSEKDRESYGMVVYLHAGGFTTGDKKDDANILKGFVNRGYVAVGINYTLRTDSNNASVLTMSNEIKEAMPIVVNKVKELGYNVTEMVISGGSAGGGLATLYAYRDGKESPLPIKFVYALVPPTSFQPDGWYGLDKDLAKAAAFFTPLTGEKLTKDFMESGKYQELSKNIESYRWINKDVPPTLIAFGKYDKVMPFTTTPYIIKALKDNLVQSDVIVFEHSGHGLHRDRDKQKELKEKLDEYFKKYMPLKNKIN